MENEIELQIIALIDKIRPFIINDGGNIEFVEYKDNIVYIKMLGACQECSMIDFTVKEGIEEFITSEIPEVKGVELATENTKSNIV